MLRRMLIISVLIGDQNDQRTIEFQLINSHRNNLKYYFYIHKNEVLQYNTFIINDMVRILLCLFQWCHINK